MTNEEIKAPRVSVLIDTFNYGHFIEQAVDSVLTQDVPADTVEILVVDDGSTDDTAQRIRKYGNRVQYTHKPNGGQGSAFNLGVQRAKGEFIVLLDADDYFLPGKLRRVMQEFESDPRVGMVYHSHSKLHNDSGKVEETKIAEVSGFLPDDLQKLFGCGLYPTSCLSFRRSLLERFLPIPESIKLQADSYLSMLALITAPVRAVPDCLTMYRVHGKNLFYDKQQVLVAERRQRRNEMFLTVLKEVEAWTKAHEQGLRKTETRLYVRHLRLKIEEDFFLTNRPGRLRFLSFLLRQNHVYARIQTWKLTLFNCMSAFSALAFGYERAQEMHAWRVRTLRSIQRVVRG